MNAALLHRSPARSVAVATFVVLTGCAGARVDTVNESATPPSPSTSVFETPIPTPNRNPIPERTNAINELPVEANVVVFEELERVRRDYLIPEDPAVAVTNVREAAYAFGAALMHGIRNPRPSSVNLELPGHPRVVSLPAGMNVLARAGMFARDAVSGVDVGPSYPDPSGRVWVAVFMGSSGPIGAVESSCVAVTLRSDGRSVFVELVDVESTVTKQPTDRRDYAEIRCILDLESLPDDGFAPQT
jgi:hypothetical protein